MGLDLLQTERRGEGWLRGGRRGGPGMISRWLVPVQSVFEPETRIREDKRGRQGKITRSESGSGRDFENSPATIWRCGSTETLEPPVGVRSWQRFVRDQARSGVVKALSPGLYIPLRPNPLWYPRLG